MTEPAREARDKCATHWLCVCLADLKLTVRRLDTDAEATIDSDFDEFLQSVIDAATTKPSDLKGLVVLHASLRRWSAYAKRAINLLEREMTRPGYFED